MKFLTSVALAVLPLYTPACAWYSFARMEIAAITWEKLDLPTRIRATELLKLNPMHYGWVKNIAEQDRDEIAFVMASTWADAIKESADYISDGSDDGNRPPPGSEASQNIGYVDHFIHKYRPISPDDTPLRQPVASNVQTQVVAFQATLSDPKVSEDVKSYDLTWLLHIVGDAHQPLHARSRFTQTQADGDAGGDFVKVDCDSGCTATKLHFFWDGVLGDS
jgi:hypothetical protein